MSGEGMIRADRADGCAPDHYRPAFRVPIDIFLALQKHAARRGISTFAIGRRIIAAVLEADLVDAVLADGTPATHPRYELTDRGQRRVRDGRR